MYSKYVLGVKNVEIQQETVIRHFYNRPLFIRTTTNLIFQNFVL